MTEEQETNTGLLSAGESAQPAEVSAEVLELKQVSVGTVRGQKVRLEASAARTIRAEEAELENAAVLRLEAGEVEAEEASIGLLRAEKVELEECSAGLVAAQEAVLEKSHAWAIFGGVVRVEEGRSLLVIGRHLDGAVQPILDLRGAVALGVAAGLSGVLVLLLRRLLRRR